MSLFDMNIIAVPVEDIKADVQLKNIRTVFYDEKIQELADSIFNEGLMCPLIIMESFDEADNPIIELVAGARRLKAIRRIRDTKDSTFMDEGVPCIQFEGSFHDAVFAMAEENISREEVDDVDISKWIYERHEEGITHTEIAERIHKSLQYVSFRYQFHSRATDELKQYLREGKIAFTSAYELSKNLSPEDQNKYLNKYDALGKKIQLADARVAGRDKSTKPSKSARDKMLARATTAAEDNNSKIAQGMVFALSWIDGLIDNEEMEHAIEDCEK